MAKGKKRRMIKKDLRYLFNHYRNNKKHVAKFFILSFILFFASLAFIGGKFFYPFHFFIGLLFFIFSIRLLWIGLFSYKRDISKFNTYNLTVKYGKKYRNYIILSLLIVLASYTAAKVYHFRYSPFSSLNSYEISELVENDLEVTLMIMDRIEIAGNRLLSSPLILKDELTTDERNEVLMMWDDFLFALAESEIITEKHKYFNHISYIGHREDNSKSFIIAYSLYMKKYELFHKLISKVDENAYILKIFNEHNEAIGGQNLYDGVTDRFFDSETFIRQGLGSLYLNFVKLLDNGSYGEEYVILKNKSNESTEFLMKNIDKSIWNSLSVGRNSFEKRMFRTWFPIQKNTADFLGDFYISSRHEKFITIDQVREMKKEMEPGDIMVQRRNWYASNIGIPGFWPHSVLYIGDIAEADKYFEELFPYEGATDFEQLLIGKYPELYKKYNENDEYGYKYSVIEAVSEGVLLQSIEHSAQADYVGVMRPRLGKIDKLRALLRAFDNYGKPYDFDFDFDTKDSIVCSELIYDAYVETKDKEGVNFELSMISGRKITSPTDMVKKYYDEYESPDREMDFVYFIDGNEELGKAIVKSEKEFITTWTRAKYDWSQE